MTVRVIINVMSNKHNIFYYNVLSVDIVENYLYLHFDNKQTEKLRLVNHEYEIY